VIIQATAPSRLSLFGSATDIPEFYNDHGGLVISMAINIYATFEMFTDDDLFQIIDNTVPIGGSLDFVYKFLDEYGVNSMHHTKFKASYDGLIGGGIGGSGAAGVAIVAAIAKCLNLTFPHPTQSWIAEKAWDVECNKLKKFCGKQDQYAAAYGGINVFEFTKEAINILPLKGDYLDKLLPSIVLFSTGIERKTKVQDNLKKLTNEQIYNLIQIKQLALDAIDPIGKGDIEKVGNLLDKSWRYKKSSNKDATTPEIDRIYEIAQKNGAYGGKICGAGQGGYMFFIVHPTRRDKFIDIMSKEGLYWWDFQLSAGGVETRILPK